MVRVERCISEFNLDFDNISDEDFFKFLRVLSGFSRVNELFYRHSSSGKGFHVRVLFKMFGRDEGDKFDYKSFLLGCRYVLGDCLGRVLNDYRRLNNPNASFDVIFDIKNGLKSEDWERYFKRE